MVRTILLSFLMLFASIAAAQQTNVRIGSRCGFSAGAGFENPICGVEAGGSYKLEKVTLDGTAHYLFAEKRPGGGHNIGGNAAARVAVGKLFVGPSVAFNRQTTNLYSKSAFSVGAEAGKQFNATILSGRFLQDFTSENRARAYDFRVEHYFKRLYIAGLAGAQDFRCFGTKRCFGAHGSISVGVHF